MIYAASMSLLGAVFPDFAEESQLKEVVHSIGVILRAVSNILLWAVIFSSSDGSDVLSLFFLIGCILHILEDAICGKVPFFSLKKNMALNVLK